MINIIEYRQVFLKLMKKDNWQELQAFKALIEQTRKESKKERDKQYELRVYQTHRGWSLYQPLPIGITSLVWCIMIKMCTIAGSNPQSLSCQTEALTVELWNQFKDLYSNMHIIVDPINFLITKRTNHFFICSNNSATVLYHTNAHWFVPSRLRILSIVILKPGSWHVFVIVYYYSSAFFLA